jgi:signal recognition particle GTPase
MTTKQRQYSALNRFQKQKRIFQQLMLGQIEQVLNQNKITLESLNFTPAAEIIEGKLNESQAKTIRNCLFHKVSLIEGPPGTGKTATVSQLAYILTQNGLGPVLICTNSNIACDVVCNMVGKSGLNVIRVYSKHYQGLKTDA